MDKNYKHVKEVEYIDKIDIYTFLRDGSGNKEVYDQELYNNVQDNLAPGEIYTYKALCETLHQERYGGNQKKSQLKELARYFDFEYDKDRKRYIIKEIYTIPQDPRSKSPANTKYADHIRVLLLSYLVKQKTCNPEGAVYISLQNLYKALGIVNQQYIEMKKPGNDKKLRDGIRKELEAKVESKDRSYDVVNLQDKTLKYYVDNFYYRCGSKFSSIVKYVLNKLDNQNYIRYYQIYILYKEEHDFKGKPITKCTHSTDVETEDILAIERQIMDEFGFKNDQDIWFGGRTVEYWDRVLEEVQGIYPDVCRLYRYYKIIGNLNNLLKALSQEQETEEMRMLNDKIIYFLNTQAENNMYKSFEESDPKKWLSNRYLDAQYYLSDKLIKIKDKRTTSIESEIFTEDELEFFNGLQ